MTPPPDLSALQAALDDLQVELRIHLRNGTPADTGPAAALDWGQITGCVTGLVDETIWCRDALIVLSRRAGRSWAGLEDDTATADSTLSGRRERFLDGGYR